MKRDSIFTWEMQQECSTQEYKVNEEGNLDLILRSNFWSAGFTYQEVDGKLKCDNGPTCKISVAGGDEVNWTILASDNDWSVHYYCQDIMFGASHMSWLGIYAKDVTLAEDKMKAAEEAIKEKLPDFDLSWTSMHTTEQGNTCLYEWNF